MHKALILSIAIVTLKVAPAFAGWSEPVRISEPGGCWTPKIIAQGDTLHVVYENDYLLDKISYVRSTDGGESWSEHIVLSDDSCQTLSPIIVRNGAKLMALWMNIFDIGPYRFNIGYSTSTNNGQSWRAQRYIFSPNWEYIGNFAASGSDTTINVVFYSAPVDTLTHYSTISTNFGQSWSQPLEMFKSAYSGVPDETSYDSLFHFVWAALISWDDQSAEVYYIRSTDFGVNWSDHVALTDIDQFHSQLPSICVQDSGYLGLIWMDYKYSPYMGTGDIFLKKSVNSGDNWSMEQQVSFDHYAWGSDVASNGDMIHIAWEDEDQGIAHRSIYHIKSTDWGQSWSEPYWLDQALDDSHEPALATSNGRVYAVWADARENPDTNVCCGIFFTRWDPEPDDIGENREINRPNDFSLSAYPNPFNYRVKINYKNLKKGGKLLILDVTGRVVKKLSVLDEKEGQVIWDASDSEGQLVSSGIYYVKVLSESGNTESLRQTELKLIYLK